MANEAAYTPSVMLTVDTHDISPADQAGVELILQLTQYAGVIPCVHRIDVLQSEKALVCRVTGAPTEKKDDDDDDAPTMVCIAKLKVMGCAWSVDAAVTDENSLQYCNVHDGTLLSYPMDPPEWLQKHDMRESVRSALFSAATNQPYLLLAYIQNFKHVEHAHTCSLILELQTAVGDTTVESYVRQAMDACTIPFIHKHASAGVDEVEAEDGDGEGEEDTDTYDMPSTQGSASTTGSSEHHSSTEREDGALPDDEDGASIGTDNSFVVSMEEVAATRGTHPPQTGIDGTALQAAIVWARHIVVPVTQAVAHATQHAHSVGIYQHDANLSNYTLSFPHADSGRPCAHIIDYDWATGNPAMYSDLVEKYFSQLPPVLQCNIGEVVTRTYVQPNIIRDALTGTERAGLLHKSNKGDHRGMLELSAENNGQSAHSLYLHYANPKAATFGDDDIWLSAIKARGLNKQRSRVQALNLKTYLTRYVVRTALAGMSMSHLFSLARVAYKRQMSELVWTAQVAQYAILVVILAQRLFDTLMSVDAIIEIMQLVPPPETCAKAGVLARNKTDKEDDAMYGGEDNAVLQDERVIAFFHVVTVALWPLANEMWACIPERIQDLC